ncbi:MAG TPA: cysteine--tRNA ligase, partial [Spirochaetota bacterium]|nr:cysteine--tRNA ligase [Spirochaetota bacterium]
MALKFYNTYTRTTEEFIPGGVKKNSPAEYDAVSIYSCGPTVYSYAHIGNFRTFTLNDLLRRYLKYSGYKVEHTMNITDVDDKTIKGANDNGLSLKDFTAKYTNIF